MPENSTALTTGTVTVGPPVVTTTPASPLAPTVAKREPLVTHSQIALMDTAQFEHMQRIAGLMAKMDLLPVHLRARPWFYPKKKTENLAPAEEKKWRDELGPEAFDRAWREAEQRTIANCILVVDQALRWGMNPFATMGETFEVGGKLANQGKLVAAVINARAELQERLRYEFAGEGDEREVTVIGTFKGEGVPRTVTLKVRDAKTDNQMWRKDPDQKLIYSGVLKWGRRHCPEVILGVVTDDDYERIVMEEAASRPQVVGSTLDAFAANGTAAALLPAGPSPSGVIDLTGAHRVESGAVAEATPPAAETQGSAAAEDQPRSDNLANEDSIPQPQAGSAQERPTGAVSRLAPDKVAKLLALLASEPKLDEEDVAFAFKQRGRKLEDLEGTPGETPQALYTRVLGEIQRLKGK
jgi:hypothetical protein